MGDQQYPRKIDTRHCC